VREKIEHMMCLVISQLDIDGFRYDKATQMTVDAEAEISASLRDCAKKLGKDNFFLPGEITGGNDFGSIYLGRGREPQMRTKNITEALLTTGSDEESFIRNQTLQALDAAAFHYSVYKTLTRFLGMDGNLSSGYDVPTNFVDIWNTLLTSNDFLNAESGVFDPRHMYGTSNQDVFRWPAIKNGTDRMLLALFITTLHMPGIPLLLWGEEQAFYVLDSTAANYVFGRQPMSSNSAWQQHGCYKLGHSQYMDWPAEAVLDGCNDNSVSLDHRDPTHPVRNIIGAMYSLRERYPILNDGFKLMSLSNQTHQIFLPGSNGTATETGMWSVVRTQLDPIQELDAGNQSVWLVYSNEDHRVTYSFDCSQNETALLAPFPEGTTVKNLLSPYEEIKLEDGPNKKLFIDKSQEKNGCLKELVLDPWGFKAFVPKSAWEQPPPRLTNFIPGHDARLASTPNLDIELHFSEESDCDLVTSNLIINSTTQDHSVPKIDKASIHCDKTTQSDAPSYGAYIASQWKWTATLNDVSDGIHMLTLDMSSGAGTDAEKSTGSVDRLMFRVGQADNPLVFSQSPHSNPSNYAKDPQSKELKVTHTAAGADKWRYSTNWGSSWSPWSDYEGGTATVAKLPWSGTPRQRWSGEHIILQYWSNMAGSSDHITHADTDWAQKIPRRFPHLFVHGNFNMFGFDGGLPNSLKLDASKGVSKFHLSTEWPTKVQLNVWGMNPDGKPDQTFVYGDLDGDNVLDRALPGALSSTVLNFSLPPSPHVAWSIKLDEASMRYELVPAGSRLVQILVFALLWALPIVAASLAIWIYMGAFYKIKFNKIGNPLKGKAGVLSFFKAKRGGFQRLDEEDRHSGLRPLELGAMRNKGEKARSSYSGAVVAPKTPRRCILIATMEYDIEDWAIKIKIGGLGVMAQLMGKALGGHDLIWVVPCVGGIDYPVDKIAEPMTVTVMEQEYEIQVQYHQLNNITYVLLDAPIFRQQSKTEPYPPRMDDLDSAIYYSAWNACIARTAERFPVDIYHINDYHGAAAPLYLLPKTIPCCLSLHNAEFQGLWPMRTKQEQEEICKAFNLSQKIVEKYVQFGGVFNLLHAGASYLRVHQGGFGAVGVSNKYGARSYARYPIFWALKEIGKLPNPDPSDTEPWDEEAEARQVIKVDPAFERARGDLRRQAQEWANLKVDPNAELFVFVGRWSVQKGVDLIADVFPAVLEKHKSVQLICVGPVIDLYGKFAALKLEAIMQKYPGRVYSKPEFTQLPPYIFSGAEFALIPSRDEPFGLVAVEFGRKGALGVGARVGGLGQMPGWWFTVESTTSKHMINQFKSAIDDALASSTAVRADMRARSAKQRFPVARWVEDLETLHGASIRIHQDQRGAGNSPVRRVSGTNFGLLGSFGDSDQSGNTHRLSSYEVSTTPPEPEPSSEGAVGSGGLGRSLSLGKRAGPGHRAAVDNSNRLSRVGEGFEEDAEVEISNEEAEAAYRIENVDAALRSLEGNQPGAAHMSQIPGLAVTEESGSRGRPRLAKPHFSLSAPDSSEAQPISPSAGMGETSRSRSPSPMAPALASLLPVDRRHASHRLSSASLLSLNEVTHGQRDFSLQKVELDFTDSRGEYYQKFQSMLQEKLTAKSSENTLVIEDFLKKSEKEWSARYRAEKLARPRSTSPGYRYSSPRASFDSRRDSAALSSHDDSASAYDAASIMDEFLLGENYVRPSILKRWLQIRILDWPIYCILLALGQIMAANSYQIVLLTGGSAGDTATKLYVVGGIYIIASCLWWVVFRTCTPRYVTSAPFGLYGLAFIIVGLAPFIPAGGGRLWARNVATGMYATASASGSLYFALNFGDEGE
jgi:alpha-1,3-glucan synthase